jgi:TyrR family helix-turn-helix protein/PAS domain S-box-containing protein
MHFFYSRNRKCNLHSEIVVEISELVSQGERFMKVKELLLNGFVPLPSVCSVQQAISALDMEAGLNYIILEDGNNVRGFVTRDILLQAEAAVSCTAIVQPFQCEVDEDALLEELSQMITAPILIRDSSGDCRGILDADSLIRSLQKLERENTELSGEINSIINFSSDEIYVTDGRGVTLRVNKAFEENSGIPVERVLGRNVTDLVKDGFFKPSVTLMVLEQKRKITLLQEYQNKKKFLVTGTPVFEKNGTIHRVIINTRDTTKLSMLKAELEEIENLKDSYYQELLNLQEDLNSKHIVANSRQMKQLLQTARKISEVDSTVLLLGETGVGKGLLARYIHDNSPRRNNIFVTINCGAIPENLLESELFGYEPGAFTGAGQKGKIGKIELADKGTLFLDEIGDLPAALQVKLLHVIQEGVIMRIGGTKEIKPDVHFLAATNRKLDKMVEERSFREDLFYRLNVIPLEIPPLRQRSEDIVPLTLKFLEKYNQKYRKTKAFSPASLEFLQNYHWPGNVRELENLTERLVIVINDDIIEPFNLPESIKMANLSCVKNDELFTGMQPLEKIKGEIEKQVLQKLYQQFNNTYKIAEFLKVNQSTVVRKLKKYGITK